MDIRIECVAGDHPTWKVFLGEFFWSCNTLDEAERWASLAEAHELMYSAYRLPARFPACLPRKSENPRIVKSRCGRDPIAKKSQQVQ